MTSFVCYDVNSGAIDHYRQSDVERIQTYPLPADHEYIEIPDDFNVSSEGVYVTGGVIVTRPSFDLPLSLSIDPGGEVTFSIPNHCQVNGEEIAGGSITLSGDMPDVFHVKFEAWPFLDHTMEVTVNAV